MGKKKQITFEDDIDDGYDSTTSRGPPPPPSMPPPLDSAHEMYGGQPPLESQDIELNLSPPHTCEEDENVDIPSTMVIREFESNEETLPKKYSDRCFGNKLYIGAIACLSVCIAVIMGVGFGTDAFYSQPTILTSQQAAVNNISDRNKGKSGEGKEKASTNTKTEVLRPQGSNKLSTNSTNEMEATTKPTVATTAPPVVTTEAPMATNNPTLSLPAETSTITLSPQEKREIELQTYTSNIKKFLSLISVNGKTTFLDPNTPESLAQQFLAIKDPLRLDPMNPIQQWRIQQRYALITLWYQSNGPSWTVSDSWILDNDECKWYGIECNENGEVKTISLENNNLYGGISDDFALLGISLTSINLADNFLEGNLPSSFQRLTKLQIMYLDRNFLSGMLDEFDFSPLQSLATIDLSDNYFRGPIPESIYDLESLQYLILDNNQLEEGISDSIAKLSNTLQRLTLSNNQLTGNIVSEVGSLVNLQVLWLFNNNFTGSLFNSEKFLNMRNLIALDVSMNKISGQIPNKFVAMPNLKVLNFGKNRLIGTIPKQLSPNLIFLNVEDNTLVGNIPIGIQNCISLGTLRLGNNAFTLRNNLAIPQFLFNMGDTLTDLRLNGIGLAGQFNPKMRALTNLETLHLQDNEFVNRFPFRILSVIGANIKYLDVSNNKLGGKIPDDINKLLPQVEHLDVSNNSFDGNLPAEIVVLEDLVYLDASSNLFGGEFPSFRGSNGLSKLEYLNLNKNNIVGTIPSLIGNALPNLKTLDASNNKLTGTIPPETSALYKLEILSLSLNSMNGAIPESIGEMGNNLQELRLHSAGFSGTLPGPALADLKKLRILELYGNQFTGNLPLELPTSLELIDFAHNSGINGIIPPSFSALVNLNEFYLFDTSISGSIPDKFCEEVRPTYFTTDCAVTCSCCTDCLEKRK